MKRKAPHRKLKLTAILLCSVLIVAFASLMTVSGVFVTPKYLEPWQKTYSQKFSDPRVRLVAHGLLAANGHNMQPWKIRLNGKDANVFYLYADSSRMTNEVDPCSRQMMVTQGTFLEYVAVAGDELGFRTAIELFPEGGYDEKNLRESMNTKPVAMVTIAKADPADSPLYDPIFEPDTNRAPYKSVKLTAAQQSQLVSTNTDRGLTVKLFQDSSDLEKLGSYAMQSAIIEAGVDRVMKETADVFRSNEYQKNRYRYGFSVEGQGASGIMLHLMQGLVTLFPSLNEGKAASVTFINSTKASIDSTPAYAMILSADNSRISQVKSGMLYSKMVLTAQSMGLAMQPLSQALEEYPEMSAVYKGIHADYAPGGGTIQMLFRIGEPTKEAPRSMRRDAMDLIQN